MLVDANDPGFATPTKPVGGFMTEAQARRFEKDGWTVVEDSGRGWRRVVASPKPLHIRSDSAHRSTAAFLPLLAHGLVDVFLVMQMLWL